MQHLLYGKTVGVFFGGQSAEHDISILTGQFVISQLEKNGVNVLPVYVSREGKWYVDAKLGKLKFFKGQYEHALEKIQPVLLSLPESNGKITLVKQGLVGKKTYTVDVAFPTFHGLHGEDGSVQGLYEFLNVPYTGCGIYASAVGIDKSVTKEFLTANKIPTSKYIVVRRNEWADDENLVQELIHRRKLRFPLFIKPARAGSSIGISKVNQPDDLDKAVRLGFYYDNTVVVEEAVPNVADLTCAVLSDGKEIVTSVIQEAKFENEFFDFEGKYIEDGGAQTGQAPKNLIIPAKVPDAVAEQIRNYSLEIFKKLRGNGTLRVDYLLDTQTNDLFAVEINTLPGTLYHHLWKASGVDMTQVLMYMLQDGLDRWEREQAVKYDLKSEVLDNANSIKLQIKD